MEVRVRPVRQSDAQGLIDVLNPIIEARTFTVLEGPLTLESEAEYLAGFPPKGVFHVAEAIDSGKIVGMQSVEPFASYTSAFDHVGVVGTYVQLDCRRRGLGTLLADATFEAARQARFEKLFTYIRSDNLASLAFHSRLGFRVIGTARRQAKIASTYVDEVIVEKFL